MRNRGTDDPENGEQTLSGSLLIAHPSLQDPNFKRTIVLISAHSNEDGAMGIVLNRPTEQKLKEIDERFQNSPLSEVPIYQGGPVQAEQMIITAWKWCDDGETFKLFFGLGPDKAEMLKETDPDLDVRAFFGYSGWTGGQLETELEADAWLVSPVRMEALADHASTDAWKIVLLKSDPDLRFFADAPDDPSLN